MGVWGVCEESAGMSGSHGLNCSIFEFSCKMTAFRGRVPFVLCDRVPELIELPFCGISAFTPPMCRGGNWRKRRGSRNLESLMRGPFWRMDCLIESFGFDGWFGFGTRALIIRGLSSGVWKMKRLHFVMCCCCLLNKSDINSPHSTFFMLRRPDVGFAGVWPGVDGWLESPGVLLFQYSANCRIIMVASTKLTIDATSICMESVST